MLRGETASSRRDCALVVFASREAVRINRRGIKDDANSMYDANEVEVAVVPTLSG
jgi:hypothetical protein